MLASDNFLDFETKYEGLNGKRRFQRSRCYNLYIKSLLNLRTFTWYKPKLIPIFSDG